MNASGSPELGIRVLVVDPPAGDTLDIASQLAPAIEGDISIDTVSGLDPARERLASEHVDCVVCRHSPPAIDGVEVLAELREVRPEVPILLATDADAAGTVSGAATDVVTLTDGRINGPVAVNRIRSIATQTRDRGKYERIFEAATDGIVVHDAAGTILEANDRFFRMLDYDPDREATLTYVDVLVDRGGYAEAEARELIASASETGGHTAEWLVRSDDDGGGQWVEVQHEPVEIGGAERVLAFVRDITARKEREAALRESRETLQRLNEITADPDLAFDEQVERLLELGRDRLGLDIAYLSRIDEATGEFEIVHAQADHELVRPGLKTELANTYCRFTVDSESPFGIANAAEEIPDSPVYQDVGFECYLGDEIVVDGELYGTLCFADESPRTEPFSEAERTLIDIMAQWLRRGLEERRYRSDLERSQSQMEQTLERVDDAFFALDDDWRVTYVNEAGADVLRKAMEADYDDAELIGRHLWDEIPEAVDTTFYQEYRRALEEQESVSFEEYYPPLDVWFEVRAYPDPDGISVYFTDVTARKEREREVERLHDLLEQTERIADVGGWEISTDGEEVFWTDYLFELLGVEADEEPPLDEALDVYHEDDRPIIENAVEEATTAAASFDVELRFWKSENQLRWLRVQGIPVVEDGEVVRVRGAAQEITERKEREQTLGRLLRAAQQLIRAGTVEDLLDAIVEGTDAVFGYGLNSVRLHDPDAGTLPAAKISPQASEYVDDLPVYDDDEGLPGEAFQSGTPKLVSDVSEHPEFDYDTIESAMFVPLDDHGVLGVGALETDAFDEDDVALVELLALVATGAFDRLERESEMRQLQRIVAHVDEMGFLLDDEDRFTFVTGPFASYVGRDADALVGERLPDLLADADAETYRELDFGDTASERTTATLEVDIRTDDGVQPVELELSRTDPDGDAVTTAGVVTDISELAATRTDLAAERKRFRELFENLPDPVVEVAFRDGDPIVQYLNPAFTDVFGHESESVRGRNLNDYIVPDHEREDALSLDAQAMDGEQTRVEVQREAESGYRDFLLRIIPYPREEGMSAFAVYTDITDQKERERYLQVMHRVLRHNLRNDINVVLALAQQLRETIEDERLFDHATTLERNAQDIASLSEKAKEIERVIGQRGDETAAVDAAAHLRETVASFRESHPEASLELDVPEPLWVRANSDLKRAFQELIENAIEHNDGDAPRLRIDAERGDADLIRLRFSDDGPGIADTEWGVVTGKTNITQLTHGSGLGLWLVRWLVESFGGEIGREERGDGTTIVVSLRRERPDAPESNAGTEQVTSED
ncbi:PAS domain S-box protein [Halobellus sp. EA9]|uniref:PAS domain S-box protein n=1 Tax=Halobellus sp. EA9 TaxID=3421647 RepID=UPI003EB8F97A